MGALKQLDARIARLERGFTPVKVTPPAPELTPMRACRVCGWHSPTGLPHRCPGPRRLRA